MEQNFNRLRSKPELNFHWVGKQSFNIATSLKGNYNGTDSAQSYKEKCLKTKYKKNLKKKKGERSVVQFWSSFFVEDMVNEFIFHFW